MVWNELIDLRSTVQEIDGENGDIEELRDGNTALQQQMQRIVTAIVSRGRLQRR